MADPCVGPPGHLGPCSVFKRKEHAQKCLFTVQFLLCCPDHPGSRPELFIRSQALLAGPFLLRLLFFEAIPDASTSFCCLSKWGSNQAGATSGSYQDQSWVGSCRQAGQDKYWPLASPLPNCSFERLTSPSLSFSSSQLSNGGSPPLPSPPPQKVASPHPQPGNWVSGLCWLQYKIGRASCRERVSSPV